ncbi:glycoside hydrolase family 43 protein [Duganella callida]|uniref:Glycoside hydrolase family 43 protein n=1 Tax=Duganella callida TaxID=2561932 RepID=A0A4Y9SQW0_9BURK|nr:glycoside hydrolase family 43 protein [Duganella callida]TFW29050.1 glycoside hydrolase family 43 protein [Duganella callida]
MIQNPILPGFNPDPSIVRVGDDYYIATSTFEWYPGVQIHHSRDLVNWRLLTRPLTRASQLNMLGAPDSCGVWAPCLTYADGLFWLIYTDVKRYGRTSSGAATGSASLRDFHNYLVTSPSIEGPWSDPVYLNSSGFDPSLFHDDDGRKYLLNQLWDHRPGGNRFAGIVMQEYSPQERKLIGKRENIFKGTPHGLTEAPHLYKRNGYYYLFTAEGGTGWNHGVTMARARDLHGPYELHPQQTILTSRNRPDLDLQRAGHADLVETPDGQTYMVYLCGRPLRNRGTCTLGRETAIQRMQWDDDGWLRAAAPQREAEAPGLPEHRFPPAPVREDFDDARLPLAFQWLRTPWPEELFSLTARAGYLRLYGRESIGSQFRQALVARRQQAHCYSASTVLEFEPEHYQQQAGLVCYYGAAKFHYLYISHDDENGKHLRVMSSLPNHVQTDTFTVPVPIPAGVPVQLRVEVDEERLHFGYRLADGAWQWLPQQFDASILSDEANAPGMPNFTGAFVGMACQDMSGAGLHADFDHFSYEERPYRLNPPI